MDHEIFASYQNVVNLPAEYNSIQLEKNIKVKNERVFVEKKITRNFFLFYIQNLVIYETVT